jgi:predicted hydrocarbon binding protein
MLSEFIKRLLFARQFFIINGKIEILGDREIMMPPDFILELQDMDEAKVFAMIKKHTMEHLKILTKKVGASGEGLFKSVQDFHETFGYGEIQIVDLDNKLKRAIVRVKDSPLSAAYLKKYNKKSSKPVCKSIEATLSGAFTFLFEKDVEAKEKSCVGQGKDFCEFVIQSKDKVNAKSKKV